MSDRPDLPGWVLSRFYAHGPPAVLVKRRTENERRRRTLTDASERTQAIP